MRAFATFGTAGESTTQEDSGLLRISGWPVRSAIVKLPRPVFDPLDKANAGRVLLRVSAFSCNYRDRGFLKALCSAKPHEFFVLGSEFSARVEAVGPEVKTLAVGDRVIGQNEYFGLPTSADAPAGGLPTNGGSREYFVLHERQLARIPDVMTDEVAAAFSIGAQTSYSMVRRSALQPGANVLVTSATSNTSLFLIAALRQHAVRIFAAARNPAVEARLRHAGVDTVIPVAPSSGAEPGGPAQQEALWGAVRETAAEIGGFHAVLDPFFDLNLAHAVGVLAPRGTYITCGLAAQTGDGAPNTTPLPMDQIMGHALVQNLSLIGNCLGTRSDLERALVDYADRRLACTVDSVFTGDDTIPFLDRTFNDRERFGKVVFRYSPDDGEATSLR